jgi:hypothetical protein
MPEPAVGDATERLGGVRERRPRRARPTTAGETTAGGEAACESFSVY